MRVRVSCGGGGGEREKREWSERRLLVARVEHVDEPILLFAEDDGGFGGGWHFFRW